MKHLTFDEWKEANRDDFLTTVVLCAECKGRGDIECQCCGSRNYCEACGGTGKVETDYGEPEFDEVAARQAYSKQLLVDAALAEQWGYGG